MTFAEGQTFKVFFLASASSPNSKGGQPKNQRPNGRRRLWGALPTLEGDLLCIPKDFPGGSDGKASAYNVGDPGSIPGSERSPGEGNGNPFQYSCLENPMDRGAC